jgi:uncharacterized protein YqjF (DUF2071 family)
VLAQTWDDVLFAHWRVDAGALRALVPDGLELDLHDGSAWLGITPFQITDLRARGSFPLPFLSSFRELNVRTYVTRDGKPGLWFLSLDASSRLAVEVGRRAYRLPCFAARSSLERRAGRIVFESVRDERNAFSATYAAAGEATPSRPGTQAHFLTERYCLYAEDRGRLARAEIHHAPWPVQTAEAHIDLNTMAPDTLALEEEPLLHYSARQDATLWPLRPA